MAQRRNQLTVSTLLLTAVLSGCAALPGNTQTAPGDRDDGSGAAAPPEQRTVNSASRSLLQQADAQYRSGSVAQAGATLERAVRIDPGEPAVWLALAEIRYAESNWQQAEQLARKTRTLTTGGTPVDDEARRLLAAALDRQGRRHEAATIRDQD